RIPPAQICTLSLHDALPLSGPADEDDLFAVRRPDRIRVAIDARLEIFHRARRDVIDGDQTVIAAIADIRNLAPVWRPSGTAVDRSEEHTSELQSRVDLVCRL